MLAEAYFFFKVSLSNSTLISIKNLLMKQALIMCALYIGFPYSYMKIVIFI